MTRAAALAIVFVACLDVSAGAQRARSTPPAPPPALAMPPAAAEMAILAAEDSRLQIPDNLHTPAIDTLRAKQMEDLRLLLQLARSGDSATATHAIRALGRLERRERVPDLLPYLLTGNAPEAATAIAQSFKGPALPDDGRGEQVQRALEALTAAGEIPVNPMRGSGEIGPVSLALGRLPYQRTEQVDEAQSYLLRMLRAAETGDPVRPILGRILRGVETLARLSGRLRPLNDDIIDYLRRVVVGRRRDYSPAERTKAMEALIASHGVNTEVVRAAATATERDPRAYTELHRLAAAALSGSGLDVAPTERADLLVTLLLDADDSVRIEAVRAWARQEAHINGCQRLLDMLKDPSLTVVLADLDALSDACKDDINVTDRLTSEAVPPEGNEWHRASHALVALAKRDSGRTFISLLGGHVQHVIWQVRMYAARAAGISSDVSALERLAFDREDNVREATLAPLRRLKGDEAEPYFVAALAHSDYQLLRTAAIELNGMKPTPQLATGLLDALRRVSAEKKETSRDTRLAILDRLQDMGDRDQAGGLVFLLRDFDIPVARRAAALIERWTGKPQEIDPQLLPRPPLPTPEELTTPPARIKLKTGRALTIVLRGDIAPLTVARFVRLAKAGYYNGLTFHRVVANFVAQGGSPAANEYGGDSLYMRDEISTASHTAGTVGLSTRGRDTGDAQFFINLVDNPRLDFEYTLFGYVAGGGDIQEGEVIESITFEKEDKKGGAMLRAPAPMPAFR